MERQTARLRHLGRLIARDRRPYCGVNGILLLVPMAATDDEADAHEAGVCCREDLATAREALQVQCPVFALVCGLEQVPGFDAFIAHFSPEQLRRRVGQRFPLVPDLAPDEVPAMIEGGVKWLGLNVFPEPGPAPLAPGGARGDRPRRGGARATRGCSTSCRRCASVRGG